MSKKSRLVDLILCWFLGVFGAHKFYEGKIGMGILYIFTLGLFGIGCIVDFIKIAIGSSKDCDGLVISAWMDDDSNTVAKGVNDYAEGKSVDTLLKYKDLLDKGIITQEEFDNKKSEIMK
ncbi:MAG: NINE protein [Bacilli bacterium]